MVTGTRVCEDSMEDRRPFPCANLSSAADSTAVIIALESGVTIIARSDR